MTINSFEDLQTFKVEVADHIAKVTLANPPVNAQNRRMREEAVWLFDVLGLRRDVRVIVLSGEGKHFCAGADISERAAILDAPDGYARHNRLARASLDAPLDCPKPVIAAVHGAAIGGGCCLALTCDILVVSDDAYMSMTEVDVGMAGGVRYVLRAFSPSDARLMIYTAKRITGPELYRMNVASACVPRDQLLATAMEIAEAIVGKVPLAVEAAKRSFSVTEEMPLRDGYRFEQTLTAALADTEDTKEAMIAFREKRKPVFHGR